MAEKYDNGSTCKKKVVYKWFYLHFVYESCNHETEYIYVFAVSSFANMHGSRRNTCIFAKTRFS